MSFSTQQSQQQQTSAPPSATPPSTPSSSSPSEAAAQPYAQILIEKRGKVGLITLNKPKQLNCLSDSLMADILSAARQFQADSEVGAIVITGNAKAFAAGADIKEMAPMTTPECFKKNMLGHWTDLTKIRKPVIAAVNGFALGGGCELAMMCDIIIAGETAVFGQPEIKLGTIPGGGGTQRLIRAIGKSKAMELILTGSNLNAHDAEKAGLVSRVVAPDQTVEEAVKLGNTIAGYSQPIVAMAKATVNAAEELSLSEGLRLELLTFHSTFSSHDQKEGMKAFSEKRPPVWRNE